MKTSTDINAERSLYIFCDAGLANRMNAIAGAKVIADRTKRKLFCYWPGNRFVGADFDDLFTWNEFNPIRAGALDNLFATRNRVKFYNCGVDETATSEWQFVEGDEKEEIVCIKSWYSPRQKPLNNHSRGLIILALPHLFRPSEKLKRDYMLPILNDLHKFKGDAPLVGVHIRHGDRKIDNATEWDPVVVNRYAKSSTKEFERAMEAVLDVRPYAKFYLASYNYDIAVNMSVAFGQDKVFTLKPGVGREYYDGIMHDAAELLTLGLHSEFIIGSHYSQFSQVAAEYHNRPLFIASEDLDTNRLKAWFK